ncbi:unnamed protein product [Eretmochelys imbricata]
MSQGAGRGQRVPGPAEGNARAGRPCSPRCLEGGVGQVTRGHEYLMSIFKSASCRGNLRPGRYWRLTPTWKAGGKRKGFAGRPAWGAPSSFTSAGAEAESFPRWGEGGVRSSFHLCWQQAISSRLHAEEATLLFPVVKSAV